MFKNLIILSLTISCSLSIQAQDKKIFLHPSNENRMKTWWFFGYENTTKEGITADVEALKDAGFGGVVYYDQNHRKDPPSPPFSALKAERPLVERGGMNTNSNNPSNDKSNTNIPPHGGLGGYPDDGFSPQWWDNLKFACKEANRVGLSFEINISNGYCAGGKWIDPQHAMQRVASAKVSVEGGKHITMPVPNIKGIENYVQDIALLAFKTPQALQEGMFARHFTARYNAVGKGRNGAMQKPGTSPNPSQGGEDFSGYGWVDVPNIGTLQVSDDSINWRDVITIEPMYRSQGGYFYRTNAFPATEGKYWRVNYFGDAKLREWSVGPEAMFDRWEERTGLHSDFAEDSRTPIYNKEEIVQSNDVIDLTDKIDNGTLDWDAPEGEWQIVRLASVLTGAKSKHGRPNLLGYECDKLSKEAAELHWNSYTQPIIDTLRESAPSLRGLLSPDKRGSKEGVIRPLRAGEEALVGITMDSHEGGAQNWTPLMLQEFEQRRGYSLKPYLLMLAGYVVDSKEKTEQVLYDFRQTIADCVRDNYFGTFQRLATKNGLTFTAQAIGNALCIDGDAISVKKVVDKPQGEFWTYQKDGAYDIKDCSSACHLYGKPIASAEAMTDAMYDTNPEDLKRVADIAFSMGAQEFVVCATPHIPAPLRPAGTSPKGEERYVAGREYAINRTNPKWNDMKWVWETSARSAYMLRQGKAAPDALIFLGDDVPIKTLTSRLPDGIEGLDWDVCTEMSLKTLQVPRRGGMYGTTPSLVTPGGISYSALIIEKQAHISPASQAKIEELRKAGVPVFTSGESIVRPLTITDDQGNILDSRTIAHTHRIVDGKDMFFLANITKKPITIKVTITTIPSGSAAEHLLWRTATGKTSKLKANADGTYTISLSSNESIFIY